MIRTFRLAGAALAFVAAPALAATAPSGISGLGARNIGSANMSGRIAQLAAREEADGKVTLYVGAASGGVWKSEDGGTTFTPKFDKQPVQSIGAISLDPSNPQTVWVGTGEGWTRNSVSIGDGIYKSTDGGDNWTNMGLPKTERITKIVVHPKNGNIVYACAPGPLWSDSADRGLYKTIDGGVTWKQVLKGGNASTGCSAISLDPSNPDKLIAGLWDFRRKGWTFRSGGDGPDAPSGSAMMTSSDGGATWSKMDAATAKGLPKGPWGRVEVVHSPADANRVYAFVENPRSALFVSNDGGKSFEERDRSQRMVWRPFYFSKLVADPKNADRVFKMNLLAIVSDDAGKSFSETTGGTHADWHDIWINPNNTRHLIGADDGGLWISHDGGNKWWKGNNLPISQFYHVSVDDKNPYQVYGGLQDNSSWAGDSEYPGGITNSRWENLYGGDGFWTFADPSDPDFVYAEAQGGNIGRVNRKTLEARDIQPKAGFKEKLRFNWNTPIHLSPNEKGTIYIGSQFLFRSRDHGDSWDRISPDLSTNNIDRQQQEKSGGITIDNSAAEMHTTIYSISESPKAKGMIWVGTDDGNIQLTRDGGKSWTNLTKSLGLGPDNWISWVEASRHDAATAYIAVDNHVFGDMAPHIFKTADFGKSWKRIVGPSTPGVRGYAHVIKEDRIDPKLLFAGTEFGMFVSRDGGTAWEAFKPSGFPAVAVRDIVTTPQGDDLVMATHGRGIWIVDDVSPLRALTPAVTGADVALIPSAPIEQRIAGSGGWSEGDASYAGQNPADGAIISYFQKNRHVIGRMKLEILDKDGNVVDELPTSKRKGLNRVEWSMRTKPPQVPPAASLAFSATQGQRFMPGTYTVRLTKAGQITQMPLVIGLDGRATFNVADRQSQFDAAERVKDLFARMTTLTAGVNAIRTQANAVAADPKTTPASKTQAQALSAKADVLRKQIVATTEGGAITGEERLRENMDSVYGAITRTEARPTGYALARVDALERELKEVEEAFAALKAGEAAALNTLLIRHGAAAIDLAVVYPPADASRGGSVAALAAGLIGTRYSGAMSALAATGEKD